MGTITVKSLVDDRLDRLLYDQTQVQWDRSTRVNLLNDAQRAVVVLRPDAHMITESVRLAPGTKQALSPEGIKVGRVSRNMGSDGETPGRVIATTDISAMDLNQTWHTDTPAAVVLNWIPDPLDPKIYYVYPPATADVYVEISYPSVPADIDIADWDTATLSIGDEFANALVEFVMFRAFDELNRDKFAGRADNHLARFVAMLGASKEGL